MSNWKQKLPVLSRKIFETCPPVITHTPDEATLRTSPSGEVIGFVDERGAHVWLGIPYAQPPVGGLRWRAPRALEPWSGLYPAVQLGPLPCQRNYFPESNGVDAPVMGEEDCLYLNIWSPPMARAAAMDAGERLPVMFWIHGGSNVGGHGGAYEAGVLALTQRVVVVTVNYRLGVFGWFRHASLRSGGELAKEDSGNFGLLDLIQALKWVQENISAFGGDPTRVTVFGQSAGGDNIYSLLVSPESQGLFHRAIIQSAVPGTIGPAKAENFFDAPEPGDAHSSNEVLLQLLMADGLATDRNAAKAQLEAMENSQVAGYLRNKTYMDFDAAFRAISSSNPAALYRSGFPFPFADGAVVPAEGISAAFSRRDINRVPIMLGCTRDEFSILLPMYESSFAKIQLEPYKVQIPDKSRFVLASSYLSNLVRINGVDEPARSLSRCQPGKVFAYTFNWNELEPAPWLDNVSLGAPHGIDIPFVFGHLKFGPEFGYLALINKERESSYRALAHAVMSYWAEFAYHGNPGAGRTGDLPRWQPWSANADGYKLMELNSVSGGGIRMSSKDMSKPGLLAELEHSPDFSTEQDRCQFFDAISAIGQRFLLLSPADCLRH